MTKCNIYSSLIIVVFLFITSCQDSSKVKENAENINQVLPGMTLDSMMKIMGNPDTVMIHPYNNAEVQYLYKSPSGYSGDFNIAVSRKDSIVIRVYDGL